MKTIEIGTAKSEPGKLTYGFIEALKLPTGQNESIPVMIAQGTEDGPTFFITANVHGNELSGVAIIHEMITEELAKDLRGTVVAIPSLNPTGLRAYSRNPDYEITDPNRLFPEGKFEKKDEVDEDAKYPERYELVAKRIFAYLEEYADYHLDIHNHSLRSIPYSIVDRIFYHEEDEDDKKEAEELAKKQMEMVQAFGMMYAIDFPPKKYIRLKYHRSLSGAALNSFRIPAFTVELGSNNVLYPEIIAGSIKGVKNVLKWVGMLDGDFEKIIEFPTPKPEENVRRIDHPRTPYSGIIQLLVSPGEKITKGQAIAKITDIFGRPLGGGFIHTEYDGYTIALRSQMTVYENDSICEIGIKDEEDILAPYP